MTAIDIEVGLTEEATEILATAHKFAEEVLRPAGIELDRLADPADVIAPESVLWRCFEKYHQIGLGALLYDEEMEPYAKARLTALINEELAWGDVGLSISLGLSGFHQPWVKQSGDEELIARFCNPRPASAAGPSPSPTTAATRWPSRRSTSATPPSRRTAWRERTATTT
jgi:alkylation response protein AidB-like acyl-CoA dehydrogenase